MGLLKVGFKRMSETATLPKRPDNGNVGWDLYSDQNLFLVPGTTKLVSTNIQLASFGEEKTQDSHGKMTYMKIEGRSGMAVKGIFPVGGIIDPNYRGEIGVVLTYNNRWGDNYEIKKGDRIAQLVFYQVVNNTDSSIHIFENTEVDETNRGSSGFGSSGR